MVLVGRPAPAPPTRSPTRSVRSASDPARGSGVLLRNRPVPVGLALGVLRAEACLVTVNPLLGRERVQRDLEELDLAVVAGQPDDLADLVTDAVAARSAVLAARRPRWRRHAHAPDRRDRRLRAAPRRRDPDAHERDDRAARVASTSPTPRCSG